MSTPPAQWRDLRRFTPARVALGRAGNGMPTAAHLTFQAAHAAARDAVHTALDAPALTAALTAAGLPSVTVRSAVTDRREYLRRPDLGRRLAAGEASRLAALRRPGCLAVVVCDGLSALAGQRHAATVIGALARTESLAPVVIALQGRVALGDVIGAALGAAAVLVLIGERPGLSAPDSLGAYLTFAPRPGRTDAERNCVSNIRAQGIPPGEAAAKLVWLIGRMRALGQTGIALKDEQPVAAIDASREKG